MSGRITTLTAAPLLAALALALSASLAMPRETDAWRGWTPVLVRYGAPLDQVVLVLEEAGVMPVWSELSQTVYLTDFVTSRRIPLEEARRRLLPEDPRRTPWIDGLERYFRAREGASIWGMLYVRDAKASAARRALSRSAFSEDW
ncbi:MAG TPA: hypothetical protein VLH39_08330, partial [Magnetospirillaceae bacterium]|nr:hypothetical protein [Magnetospirillaceae bacterium]